MTGNCLHVVHSAKGRFGVARAFAMRFRSPVSISCRVAVALLLVSAVATVLITPDLTDDVHAVLHSHRTLHAPGLLFAFAATVVVMTAERWRGTPSVDSANLHSRQLLCTCRC